MLREELGDADAAERVELDAVRMPPANPLPDNVLSAAGEAILTGHADRVLRAGGKSYPDLVRARSGDLPAAPDAVVTPTSAAQVTSVLEACAKAGWRWCRSAAGPASSAGWTRTRASTAP